MGEGGVNPEYFLHTMQWWEVNRYLTGMYRRQRTAWLTNRHLEWLLVRMFSDTKKSTPPSTPEDLYKFGWEEEETPPPPEMSEEDYAEELRLLRDFKW